MHVALWSPAWPLEKFQNGIVTYVHWMKIELERRGHQVSVFTTFLDASGAGPGIHPVRTTLTERLWRRLTGGHRKSATAVYGYDAEIASVIRRVHRRNPIDVIEMEESFGWCAEVRQRTGLPMLVKLHGPAFLSMVGEELDSPAGRERIRRETLALRNCPFIVSPSQLTLEQTIKQYELQHVDTSVVVNPLTMADSTPLWQLDCCDRDCLLFVGRFDLRKGADVALQAFRILLDNRPHLKLVFVGPDAGWTEADGSTVRFASYVERLFPEALRDRVDFRGRMPNQEIAQLRTRAMATIIASRWENQSYALLEAMYQGCPVVSTDAGGCPESIQQGVSGWLAHSGDPQSFASRLEAILEDPQAAAAMGRAAREHVRSLHSAAAVADRTLAAYGRVLSGQRPEG